MRGWWWVPVCILSGLVWDGVSAWLARHAFSIQEDELLPECRVLAWGYIQRERDRLFVFLLKLPSYAWERLGYSRRYGWHQRALCYSSTHGWSVAHIPCKAPLR